MGESAARPPWSTRGGHRPLPPPPRLPTASRSACSWWPAARGGPHHRPTVVQHLCRGAGSGRLALRVRVASSHNRHLSASGALKQVRSLGTATARHEPPSRHLLCRASEDDTFRSSHQGQAVAPQVIAHRVEGGSGRVELAARLGSAARPASDGSVLSMLKDAIHKLACMNSGPQRRQPGGAAAVASGDPHAPGAACRCHSAPRARRRPSAGAAPNAGAAGRGATTPAQSHQSCVMLVTPLQGALAGDCSHRCLLGVAADLGWLLGHGGPTPPRCPRHARASTATRPSSRHPRQPA